MLGARALRTFRGRQPFGYGPFGGFGAELSQRCQALAFAEEQTPGPRNLLMPRVCPNRCFSPIGSGGGASHRRRALGNLRSDQAVASPARPEALRRNLGTQVPGLARERTPARPGTQLCGARAFERPRPQ